MKTRLLLNFGLLLGINLTGINGSSTRLLAADPAVAPADRPLNLARTGCGTRLTVQTPTGVQSDAARATQALLTEDDPLGYELAAGTTSVILTLPQAEVVHRLNFLNLTAAGKVSVAVSNVQLPADSPRWRALGAPQDFAEANEVIACDLGSAEARYVQITLDVQTPGRIDTLGLFGRPTIASTAGRQGAGAGGKRFVGYEYLDYGNIASQARIIKVSSGSGTADQMIDGNLKTGYGFEASDKRPTAVVDLGSSRTLTRVSIAYKAGPGRMDFYLMPDPAQRGGMIRANASYAGQTATIPDVEAADFPSGREPVGSVTTDGSTGLRRATVSLAGQSGRYLAVVFTPRGGGMVTASGRRATVDVKDFKDFKDFKDTVAEAPAGESEAPSSPLEISEVTAFGPPPGTFTSITQLPPGGTTVPEIPPMMPVPPGAGLIITP